MRKFKHLYCLLISILGCYAVAAQNGTFITRIEVGGAGFDILEDSKGCFLVFTAGEMLRLNKSGEIISRGMSGVSHRHHYFPNDDRVFEFSSGNSFDLDVYSLKCEFITGYPQTKLRDEIVGFYDMFYDPQRKLFIACGFYGNKNMRYTGWVAGIDSGGNQLWTNLIPSPTNERYGVGRILPTNRRGEYVCLLEELDAGYYNELYLIDSTGNVLRKAPLDPNPGNNSWGKPYDLYRSTYVDEDNSTPSFTNLTDSTFVMSVIPPGKSQWDRYFYIYDQELNLKRKIKGGGLNQTRIADNRMMGYLGNYIGIMDSELQDIDSIIPFKDKAGEYFDLAMVRESADGGFYGVASGYYASDPWKTWIIVFKTDKDGNIENKEGYSEWDQPLMLQPNPAKDEVRVAIPYYFGEVESWIFDAQGNEMLYYKHNELDPIDISALAAGVYIVHARIVETGEVRKMKLVVEN